MTLNGGRASLVEKKVGVFIAPTKNYPFELTYTGVSGLGTETLKYPASADRSLRSYFSATATFCEGV